jgi:hypothetical protein
MMGNNNDGNAKDGKVIRLDLSRTARAFEEEESLWDDEINRMLNLIETHVEALGKLPKDLEKEKKPLLSIGIFGTPGSGKTSLLQTFVKKARSNKPEDDQKKEFVQIESLPVIRPNNVAEDDHFLYAFLANALKEDRDMNENSGDKFRDPPVLSQLQQSFQEVSQYLQVINRAEESQEDDPLGKSLERLERHESGLLLIEKMAAFIEELVDMKTGGKKSAVVLLPVDDADMSMDILVSALDTYWRYLKHPRLVPVFTFTGRLAEELLRIHYESKLILKGRGDSSQELKESATSLKLTENMAIQYLGRLFPVRNRIRVGLAAARVLRAEYTKSISSQYETGQEESNKQKPKKVLDLLEYVSRLLFGHPGSFDPKIRAPLRMVTLRRQIQIVDAMHEAGIDELIKKIKEENSTHEKSWAYLFDLGTWTLLNAHRDIMREINMYLDDLYSWTPHGLRMVLRSSILSLDLRKRRRLLTKWRYRTEGRRTQMLSLLAANTFRPWMEGIEPTGDDIEKFSQWERDKKEKYTLSFPVRDGVTWFLDLCIGFYLPLIVGCNFPDNPTKKQKDEITVSITTGEIENKEKIEKEKERSSDSITAIGWECSSGPLHAIREALFNKDRFFSGMWFIKCEPMIEVIEKINNKADLKKLEEEKNKYDKKYAKYKEELKEEVLGQLKEEYKKELKKNFFEILKNRDIETEEKEILKEIKKLYRTKLKEKFPEKSLEECIEKMEKKFLDKRKEGILKKLFIELRKDYCLAVKKMDCYKSFPVYLFCYYGYEGEGLWAAVSFWSGLGLIGQLLKLDVNLNDRKKKIRSILRNHVNDCRVIGHPAKRCEKNIEQDGSDDVNIFDDIKKINDLLIPLEDDIENWLEEIEKSKESIYPLLKTKNWETCFIRRLHGESIISEFWRELENVYFKIPWKNLNPEESEHTDYQEKEKWQQEKVEKQVKAVKKVIEEWVSVLKNYWCGESKKNQCSDMKDNSAFVWKVLMECPILKPFMPKKNQKNENKNQPEEVER